MRLDSTKLVYNQAATFGKLIFMEFDSENFVYDDDGKATAELRNRVYNIMSERQGEIIRVSVAAETAKKDFKEGDVVDLVEFGIISSVDRNNQYARREYYVTAKDIRLASENTAQNTPQKTPGKVNDKG